jgi:hypothetical protein
VYHLPGYVAACARLEGGEAVAVLVTDDTGTLLLPLVLRPVSSRDRDATSPYGYPGPLISGWATPDLVDAALGAVIDLLDEHEVISLFVRFHPLLGGPLPSGVGELVQHASTVAIDLSHSHEELWTQTRRNHRDGIRAALHAGYRFWIDPTFDALPAFISVYRETMERVNARASYHFDDRYYDELRSSLGEDLHLGVVVLGTDVAAAGLITTRCDIVQLHLAGVATAHVACEPMKLLIHGTRAWAKDHHQRWLHLGGGRGATPDGLLHFKAGFSPSRWPFHTLRVVISPARYAALAAAGAPEPADPGVGSPFPSYR